MSVRNCSKCERDQNVLQHTNSALEIVKCGFWCKLPLFYHFCGAPTQQMKISDFPIYSFTNDLLLQFIRFGLYERSQLHPIGYFIIPTIYYNVRNLLYGFNFSWSLSHSSYKILSTCI